MSSKTNSTPFKFNKNNSIRFNDDLGFVSGTDICKAINKSNKKGKLSCYDFLRTTKANESIANILTEMHLGEEDKDKMVSVSGNNTWMHPRLAYDFACWCEEKSGTKSIKLSKFIADTFVSSCAMKRMSQDEMNDFVMASLDEIVNSHLQLFAMFNIVNERLNMLIDYDKAPQMQPVTEVNGMMLASSLVDPSKINPDDLSLWLQDAINWLSIRWDLDYEHLWIATYEAYSRQTGWNWRANREAFVRKFGSTQTVKNMFIYTRRLPELCSLVYGMWGDGRVPVKWNGIFFRSNRTIDLIPLGDGTPGCDPGAKKTTTPNTADDLADSKLSQRAKEVLGVDTFSSLKPSNAPIKTPPFPAALTTDIPKVTSEPKDTGVPMASNKDWLAVSTATVACADNQDSDSADCSLTTVMSTLDSSLEAVASDENKDKIDGYSNN